MTDLELVEGALKTLRRMQEERDWTNHAYPDPASVVADYCHRLQKSLDEKVWEIERLHLEAERLRCDNDRMREALEDISDVTRITASSTGIELRGIAIAHKTLDDLQREVLSD